MNHPFREEDIGLRRNAERFPEKPAIIYRNRQISWHDFNASLNRVANAFRNAGVQAGDHIAIMSYNCPEYLMVVHGLGKLGATTVLVNYRFKTAEIVYIVNNSDARGLVFGAAFREYVDAALPQMPALDRRLLVMLDGEEIGPYPSFEGFCSAASEAEPEGEPRTGVSNTMIYTSGTTGTPKGVLRTRSYPLRKFIDNAKLFNLSDSDRHLLHCPLYHSAPMAWANNTLYYGATLVILPRFDGEDMLRHIDAYRITTTTTVPTVLNACVSLPPSVRAKYRTDSLKLLLMGGAPCPLALKRRIIEHFGDGVFFEYYGSTEAGMNTSLPPGDQLRGEGCTGRPMPGNELKILDEQGRELPSGEVGTIYIKNYQLLDAYYNDPEKTAAAFRGDFFTLGDMGYLDDDGYLFVVDRSQDMVISGGVNVYPAELEKVLAAHQGVRDVAVIGVPDEYWGEVLKAVVVPMQGWAPNAEELMMHCSRRLADFKKPRSIEFVDDLPYNPSGKVLKLVLRQRYGSR